MRRLRAGWLVGLACCTSLGCLPAPLAWSPDGRWLAYTVAVRPDLRVLKPGWLFDTRPEPQPELLGWGDPSQRPRASVHRLWASRSDGSESVLLEESAGPLTSPVWSPDGKALAFGRLVDEGQGRARFEVVVQDAPDRKRVLATQPATQVSDNALNLPALSMDWSPDGRYLAVPALQRTLGLQIIRADNGRLLKEIPDAYFPSWSPDSSRLAFVRGTEIGRQSLHCLNASYGEANHADEIGQVIQPPVWSRDRRSVMVVTRIKGRQTFERDGMVSALLRMPADRGPVQRIGLSADQPDRDRPDLGASFSFDPDGDTLVYSMDAQNQQSIVASFFPGGSVTRLKDNPVDFVVRLSALSVSPAGKVVAFRAGGPHYYAPPAVWDLSTLRFTPIVPDDAVRVQWIGTLVAAARQLVRDGVPPPADENGRTIERPTLLPIPGELSENHPTFLRLKRLGRHGIALCDRPVSAAKPEPEVAELIEEARLFFSYLSGDYGAALAALEALEARTTSAEERLRLLSLRAQIHVGRRQMERAQWTIDFLESLERTPRRVEDTPAGPKMTTDAAPGTGWPRYLAARSQEYIKALPPHLELPRFGGLPEAPVVFPELRADEVPVLIGNDAGDGQRVPPRRIPRAFPPRVRRGLDRDPG